MFDVYVCYLSLFIGTCIIDVQLYFQHRRLLHKKVARKYVSRVEAKKSLELRRPETSYSLDPTDEVFTTIRPEDATGPAKNSFIRNK